MQTRLDGTGAAAGRPDAATTGLPVNPRLDSLADYPFQRLRTLLDGRTPTSNEAPLALSIGEPQGPLPDFALRAMQSAEGWNRYPPIAGTEGLRGAISGYLERRYGAAGRAVDAERGILPLSGTREGLFLLPQVVVDADRPGPRPVVLIPDPFYAPYEGAAVAAGAEPWFVPSTAATGFLPDFAGVPREVLDRTVLAYLCNPTNPQGAVADREWLAAMIDLARRHGFLLAVDECYAEIWGSGPPSGAIQVAWEETGSLDGVLVFHSLSKRSNAAGLRSGFLAGDVRVVAPYARLRSYAAAGMPLPIQEASAALWADDAHVGPIRERYRLARAASAEAFGTRPGYRAPEAGFFEWLDVGDGEAATAALWERAALRVLPGAYLSRGQDPAIGRRYVRIALVHEPELLRHALARAAEVLSDPAFRSADP